MDTSIPELTSVGSEHYDQEFNDLCLSNIEFSAVLFDNCTFSACDLSESVFSRCNFRDCHFDNCNLSVMKVGYSRFSDVTFDGCKIVGVDWTQGQWPKFALGSPISFRHCVIDSSSFYGLPFARCHLVNCHAHDVDFRGADLTDADFSDTDLLTSLFDNTVLTRANFNGSENYSIDVNNNVINQAKFCRLEAVCLLDGLGIELID